MRDGRKKKAGGRKYKKRKIKRGVGRARVVGGGGEMRTVYTE